MKKVILGILAAISVMGTVSAASATTGEVRIVGGDHDGVIVDMVLFYDSAVAPAQYAQCVDAVFSKPFIGGIFAKTHCIYNAKYYDGSTHLQHNTGGIFYTNQTTFSDVNGRHWHIG